MDIMDEIGAGGEEWGEAGDGGDEEEGEEEEEEENQEIDDMDVVEENAEENEEFEFKEEQDDETTLIEEEKLGRDIPVEKEIELLEQEAEMDIEQLRAMYAKMEEEENGGDRQNTPEPPRKKGAIKSPS
jgi:hypothetical protein